MNTCHICCLSLLWSAAMQSVSAQSDCSGSLVGAVLGTFFSTLAAVVVVLGLVYWCHLKERLDTSKSLPQAESGGISTGGDTPAGGEQGRLSINGDGAADSSHEQFFPESFPDFLSEKEIPAKDVSSLKLLCQGDDLGFSVGAENDFIVVTDVSESETLPHVKHLQAGHVVLGVSIAFQRVSLENLATVMGLCSQNPSILYVQKPSPPDIDPAKPHRSDKDLDPEVTIDLVENEVVDVVDKTEVRQVQSSHPPIPPMPDDLRLPTPTSDHDRRSTSSSSSHNSIPLPFQDDSSSEHSDDATPRASPHDQTPTPHILDALGSTNPQAIIDNGGTDSPASSRDTLLILDTGDDPVTPVPPIITGNEDSDDRQTPTPTPQEPIDDGKFRYSNGETVAMPIFLVRNGRLLSDPERGTTMDVQMRTIKSLPSQRSLKEPPKLNGHRKESLTSDTTVMLDSDNEYIDLQVADEDIVRDPTIQVIPMYKRGGHLSSRSPSVSTTSTEAFEQEYRMYPIDL